MELLPLSDFPGERNWGYDPAAQYAPAHAYGTPDELRELVDEAHKIGLAVYLDVVYNHFGPDGAYVVGYNRRCSPIITTPRGVRRSIWTTSARRTCGSFSWKTPSIGSPNTTSTASALDAVFAIIDDSPKHFLAELAEVCEGVPGWRRILIAEDPRNERKLVEPRDEGVTA